MMRLSSETPGEGNKEQDMKDNQVEGLGMHHPNAEAFRQGQRDREQGWPDLSEAWRFEGWQLHAYRQGYEHPRVPVSEGRKAVR
jgi:hypothetical protein